MTDCRITGRFIKNRSNKCQDPVSLFTPVYNPLFIFCQGFRWLLRVSMTSRTNKSASIDLFADFDFKLTVYDRYDSDPPVGNETNDYGITVGLSWSR